MAGENESAVNDVVIAVDALRKTVEEYGVESAQYKEMIEKTDKTLEEDHKVHTEVMQKLSAAEKKSEEMEERIKDFEAEMAKFSSQKSTGVESYKDSQEYKSLTKYFQQGEKGLDDEDADTLNKVNKTMRMDDDTMGGYLTTSEFDNVIIKKITEISPVRAHARVRTVSKKTLDIPKRDTLPTATYEGEAASGDDDNTTYGSEQLTVYRLTVTVPFTMDLLMDSAFDLESEINGDVSESMAQKEGNKFILGTRSKQPEGIITNAEIIAGASTTAGALTISGDDIMLLTGKLKRGYNPMFGFNRGTLAFLRTLKVTDGRYLWQTSLAADAPNQLAGEPYDIFQDLPLYSVANAYSVIYGDLKRGYTITDRTGMVIIRDQYAKKRQAIIEITFHRWNTGQVILAEAITALKTKAS